MSLQDATPVGVIIILIIFQRLDLAHPRPLQMDQILSPASPLLPQLPGTQVLLQPDEDMEGPGHNGGFRVVSGEMKADGSLLRGLTIDVSMVSDHVLITAALDPAVEQGEGNYGVLMKYFDGGAIEIPLPANAHADFDLDRCITLAEGQLRGKLKHACALNDMLCAYLANCTFAIIRRK